MDKGTVPLMHEAVKELHPAALLSIVRRALNDPATVVARAEMPGGLLEPLSIWQARAVAAALDHAGQVVISRAQFERLRETASQVRAAGTAAFGEGEGDHAGS
jgi:hypothetical protein